MNDSFRVHIFHRNRLLRECLSTVLQDEGRFEVTGEDLPTGFWGGTFTVRPDILIVDLGLPDDMAREIICASRKQLEQTRVLLLVPREKKDDVANAVAMGAHGCVIEDSSIAELRAGIDQVMAGNPYVSAEIIESMFSQLAEMGQRESWKENTAKADLTRREIEILDLVAKRRTNREIAEVLDVSMYTVKNHVHNILDKLAVGSRVDAVEVARARRWL